MPTTQGYWTEGKVVQTPTGPLNVGGGTFVQGTPPSSATSAPAVTTTTTAASSPVPPRTPGLLDDAKAAAVAAAQSRAAAQLQADAYAASQRQARIDAINTAFAPRISREKTEGDARLSRVAALNVRSGIVGSGVDTTKLGDQKSSNDKSLQAIEDAKATAIQEAFGWADELARQRAEDIYKSNKEGAEANVKRYQDQTNTALEALKAFGKSDVTADKLKVADPNTYNTLRDVSGMSDAQIDAYLKVNAPEGTYQWSAAEINGSTMYVPKVVNGKVTMEKVDMGFVPAANKKVNSTVKTDDGVLVIYGDGTYDVIGGNGVENISGFKDSKVETDIRADAVALMDSVDAGELTIDKAYARLRKLYSPEEVTDDALRGLLDIQSQETGDTTATSPTTSTPSNPAMEKEIEQLSKSGILTKADVRYALKKRGYSDADISNSSVADPITSVLSSLESFLFGR